MKYAFLLLLFMMGAFRLAIGQEDLFSAGKGIVSLTSDAPLELIEAESRHLRGMINSANKSFAFTMNINSFEGFNSEIQRVHFLENYMEHKKYPQATFTGKIIEDISFNVPGVYTVRAKGDLEIHGITKERIIKGTLTIKPGGMHITTDFSVPVADHGISIPKIVNQKIAEEVKVKIDIDFIQADKS